MPRTPAPPLPFVALRRGRTLLLAALMAGPLQARAAVEVPVVEVRSQATRRGLEIDGAVQAVRQATVAAQVSGNVLQLQVRAGDQVKAGQPLARIDERGAVAALAQSSAGVAQAEADLRNARTQLERSRELRAQGYVSQSALDNAENQFKAAEAGMAQAGAGRQQAALTRSFASVTAPFEGVVLATHLDTGDLAIPGRAVATVYQPGALRAVVQVPASQAMLARTARRIEVQLPDQRWVAPVRRTDLPTADAVTQTVEWRLDLSGADGGSLLPGQTVRVRFADPAGATTASATALSVPVGALLRRGELTAVYVARGGQFVLRAVRPGATQGDRVEVLAGLSAGERVATDAVRAGLADAHPAAAR